MAREPNVGWARVAAARGEGCEAPGSIGGSERRRRAASHQHIAQRGTRRGSPRCARTPPPATGARPKRRRHRRRHPSRCLPTTAARPRASRGTRARAPRVETTRGDRGSLARSLLAPSAWCSALVHMPKFFLVLTRMLGTVGPPPPHFFLRSPPLPPTPRSQMVRAPSLRPYKPISSAGERPRTCQLRVCEPSPSPLPLFPSTRSPLPTLSRPPGAHQADRSQEHRRQVRTRMQRWAVGGGRREG